MSEASSIIKAMYLSDKKIAEVIGFTKLAVMQVRLERSQGTRMLPKLRQLYHMRYGTMPQASHTPNPHTSQVVADIAPKTEEELVIEDEGYDLLVSSQGLVPHPESTVSLVRQASRAILTSHQSTPERRIVESIPKQMHDTPSHQLAPSLPLWLQLVGWFLMPHQPLPSLPQEKNVLPVIPKYTVTQQWAKTHNDTSQVLRLSTPSTPRVSSLGYSNTSEQVFYGSLFDTQRRGK